MQTLFNIPILEKCNTPHYCKTDVIASTVYLQDCLSAMAEYPDNYFDLAIVDPPYGINATNMQMGTHKTRTKDGYPGTSTATKIKGRLNTGSGKHKNRMLNKSVIDWDNEKPTKEYFDQLFRISKNQIIWGGNYFDLPPCRGFIVWNKNQPWENFSQAEFAWTSFDSPAKVFTFSNRGGANSETKIHPTQKPVELYDYCYSRFATEGMKILDTHLGSGSSRISADKSKLDFTAYETNEMYFNDQEKRYLNYKSQLRLW
jgi:site-specific DNA-methyltransferase (adenine-specific)